MDSEDDKTEILVAPRKMVTSNIELIRPLGRGGMGHVWVARHRGLRSEVVVKFMAEHLASDPEATARFSREAAAASQVRSPHVVQVFDHGVSNDGRLYIAMELLEGCDLAAALAQRGRIAPAEAITIVTQVARALTKAHERGTVHRDIKPENIFLTDPASSEPFVKVLDFGVAKTAASAVGRATATGAMVGTPAYMAPEQIMGGRAIGPAADLWALGVVTFEMLTGTLPFNGPTLGALSVAICTGDVPRPSQRNAALTATFDNWFLQACARDPQQRFATANDMASALRSALAGQVESTPSAIASRSDRARHTTTSAGVASTSPHRSKVRWLIPAAALGLAVVGGVVGVAFFVLSRAIRTVPEAPDPGAPHAVTPPPSAPTAPETASTAVSVFLPPASLSTAPSTAEQVVAPRPPNLHPRPKAASSTAPQPEVSVSSSPSTFKKKTKNVVIE